MILWVGDLGWAWQHSPADLGWAQWWVCSSGRDGWGLAAHGGSAGTACLCPHGSQASADQPRFILTVMAGVPRGRARLRVVPLRRIPLETEVRPAQIRRVGNRPHCLIGGAAESLAEESAIAFSVFHWPRCGRLRKRAHITYLPVVIPISRVLKQLRLKVSAICFKAPQPAKT